MKMLLLAAVAATLSLSVAPAVAMTGVVGQDMLQSTGSDQAVDRRSGRCPGGELRYFVPGCSGV